jgi:tetratricopeptide (TPR) repeat protein
MVVERVAAAIGLSTTAFPVPELFWGIRKLLEAIASRRPLVAIVDDINVAAPTFLELLDHLLEAVHGSPILLLATARRELLETHSDWSAAHEYDHLILDPLSADESDSFVTRLLGGLEASVRERITTAAEGNPLYVEQITAMLVESGAIRREGDTWVAAGTSSEIDIPPTIQALVAARLDALGSEERQVVDPASVIGLGFAVEAVTHLVPEEAALEVPDRLASLTAKQLVRPAASESDFYRFGHAVIKDAAYRSLLKRTRADLHERFVDWAEPINRERGRELEFEEILGFHLEQAYRYRGELGPIDELARTVGQRGAEKLSSAGRRAFGRGDAAAAGSLLGRATRLLPVDHPGRIELLPEVAEALIESGAFDEARSTLDEAIALSETLADRRLRARAVLVSYQLMFSVSGSVGNVDAAIAAVREAMTEFESIGDLAGQARAWRLLSVIDGTTGRYDRAADAAAQVVVLATQVDDSRLAARGAISYAYATLHGSTPVGEAAYRGRQYLDFVRTDRNAEAIVLGVLAQLEAMEGRFEEARGLAARSRAIVAELGASVTAASTSLETSRVEHLAGDHEAAELALRRDYVVLESMNESYFRSTVAALLGDALWRQGKRDEAARFARIAAELADDDDVLSQVVWRTVEARSIAAAGRWDEAIALARKAVELAGETVDIELHGNKGLPCERRSNSMNGRATWCWPGLRANAWSRSRASRRCSA